MPENINMLTGRAPQQHRLQVPDNSISTFNSQRHRSVGSQVSKAAIAIIMEQGPAYAFRQAPTSPHPNLSGNRIPGLTPLGWLKNQNKCNQFVGDTLTRAGFTMPTYRMIDGSEHYLLAEKLPHQSRFFSRINRLSEVSPGDLLAVDYLEDQGASGGHVEIVVYVNLSNSQLLCAGAHRNGAYTEDKMHLLDHSKHNPEKARWEAAKTHVYFLRPRPRPITN